MAEVILMPRLSDTMTEGVVAAWHKNVGDTVKKGDLLGWFNMGSTVITLFSEGSCHWNEELEIGNDIQMGKSMGSINT